MLCFSFKNNSLDPCEKDIAVCELQDGVFHVFEGSPLFLAAAMVGALCNDVCEVDHEVMWVLPNR